MSLQSLAAAQVCHYFCSHEGGVPNWAGDYVSDNSSMGCLLSAQLPLTCHCPG
jgi:hypothetical protein